MCLLCSSVLPCSSSPIHVDTTALCEAALSLKKLHLRVVNNATHEPLARIFVLQTLEELVLVLHPAAEVSSACSPGMYVRTYVVVRCELWRTSSHEHTVAFLLFLLLLSTLELFECITCATLLPTLRGDVRVSLRCISLHHGLILFLLSLYVMCAAGVWQHCAEGEGC